MSDIVLTTGQENAYGEFSKFITKPGPGVFVLEGYSGTGKSTLVETIMARLPDLLKTIKLLDPNRSIQEEVVLTATTNQAADQFSRITGQDVRTIHSALGLRVERDFKNNRSKLVVRGNADPLCDSIVFVDEASYMDKHLLKLLFQQTENCKVILIGDPAQLLNVGCSQSPVFVSNFPKASLTEVVRQAKGNPIVDLSTMFRETVNTGDFFSFEPDGHHIQHLDREAFDQAIIQEFDDPTWNHFRSKVLAWTNARVIDYNKAIRSHVKGTPQLHDGDFAVCNHFLQVNAHTAFKTDQVVSITGVSDPTSEFGVDGRYYWLEHKARVFMPDSREDMKARLKEARTDKCWNVVRAIESQWADLRAAYACTINKSQGSTFDRVFIDLDDIKRCNNGNQIARMMYVAVSRARHQVFLTGDLV